MIECVLRGDKCARAIDPPPKAPADVRKVAKGQSVVVTRRAFGKRIELCRWCAGPARGGAK